MVASLELSAGDCSTYTFQDVTCFGCSIRKIVFTVRKPVDAGSNKRSRDEEVNEEAVKKSKLWDVFGSREDRLLAKEQRKTTMSVRKRIGVTVSIISMITQ